MTIAQTEIEIHEFSTGIRPERTADGGWVSLGFTGQYMNATIDPVPHAIQRSIANKEFAVAEGASSDEPAIIGRVVSGEDSDWSVVAVVTKGRDEKGRSASLYRYFFCEGDKGVSNLWRIISWIEDYQRSHNGDMPVFNPFDTRELEQPNLYTTSTPPQFSLLPETEASLLSNSAPILIPPEAQYTLQDINRLANKKARPDNNQQPKAIADENQQPIAWAYKVKALEQPGRFQIIQAASDKAYELLQKVKATTPQVVAPLIDEQAFKAAIKGLINSSRVKLEYVQAIAEPLGNDQIPESYWKEIFDSQGANNALKQGIYSPQMVRLLTLRAIVIPQTLPEYLVWLENGNQQNNNYKLSADFQFQIRNSFNQITQVAKNIELNITEGIRLLLPNFLDQKVKVTVEAVLWLLTTPHGLWAAFSEQIIHELEHDLQLMIKFARGYKDLPFKLLDKSWHNIRDELKQYWQKHSFKTQEKYQIFAELFEQLHQHKLSVFFYHVGFGKVNKEIFIKVCPNAWHCVVFGIDVERKLTILEYLWFAELKVESIEMRILFVILIAMISLGSGLAGGKFLLADKPISQSQETTSANSKYSVQETTKHPPTAQAEQLAIPKEISSLDSNENKALKQFATTNVLINQKIINTFSNDKDVKTLIIKKLKLVLQNERLNDQVINDISQVQNENDKLEWIKAIYIYQKNKYGNADGILDKEGKTATDIRKDIITEIKKL